MDELTRAIAEALGCEKNPHGGRHLCEDYCKRHIMRWYVCERRAEHVAAALAPLIEARVREVEEERDRNKRAAVTLGKIVDRQCRDVLDATGMHHVIGEDGDGDWALVWERLAEIGAFIKAIDEPPNEVRRA